MKPGLPHHVVFRGNNRRRLFSYANDYAQFLDDVYIALKRTECQLHAMTLLSNHGHQLVTPPTAAALGLFVKTFAERYAQYRNRRRKSTGKLYQERYFSRVVEDDADLAVVSVYIDLNAVRAGMIADPLEYRWSTYAIHAGYPGRSAITPALWTPSPWYANLAHTDAGCASRYVQFARDSLARPRPSWAATVERYDVLSRGYSMRLERPDRTSAMEPRQRWVSPSD